MVRSLFADCEALSVNMTETDFRSEPAIHENSPALQRWDAARWMKPVPQGRKEFAKAGPAVPDGTRPLAMDADAALKRWAIVTFLDGKISIFEPTATSPPIASAFSGFKFAIFGSETIAWMDAAAAWMEKVGTFWKIVVAYYWEAVTN